MAFWRSLSRSYLALPVLVRLGIAAVLVALFIILTQSIQIFPGAAASIFEPNFREPSELPEEVESIFIETEDRERIELWRLSARPKPAPVVLIFHGNAGDVGNFFGYQQYFASLGMTSYGFDYRGFGRSSGWPSEQGLYADGRAAANYVLEREKISAIDLLIVGISIGGGAATRIVKDFGAGGLLLFSPFTSLPDAVRSVPLFGVLAPFTFYDFPVARDISELKLNCLIVAHGEKDDIIPFEQGRAVFGAYSGGGQSSFVSSKLASHNDLMGKVISDLTTQLKNCYP